MSGEKLRDGPDDSVSAGTKEGTFEADGFGLRYRVEGTGAPAIVIGSALYYSRVFSPELRRHLRMAFVDHRGFASPPEVIQPRSFELDTLLDDVEGIRRHLGFCEVVVVGHSGHAYMALEYAKKYRDAVSHVVMIAIAPRLGAEGAAAAQAYFERAASPARKAALEANYRAVPNEALAGLSVGEVFIKVYLRDGPRAWYDPHFDAAPFWQGVEPNEIVPRVWTETFGSIDVTRGLAALDKPVFLALGRHDYLVAPPESWELVRPHFTDLTVRIFERSGHTPQYEERDAFDAELLRWLASRPTASLGRASGGRER